METVSTTVVDFMRSQGKKLLQLADLVEKELASSTEHVEKPTITGPITSQQVKEFMRGKAWRKVRLAKKMGVEEQKLDPILSSSEFEEGKRGWIRVKQQV